MTRRSSSKAGTSCSTATERGETPSADWFDPDEWRRAGAVAIETSGRGAGAHRRARRGNLGAASLSARRARRALHRRSLSLARRRAHARVSRVAAAAAPLRRRAARAESRGRARLSHGIHLYRGHHHDVFARHAQAVVVHRARPRAGRVLAAHRRHDSRRPRPRCRPSRPHGPQRSARRRGEHVPRRLRQRASRSRRACGSASA